MKSRVLGLLLAVAMVFTMLPTAVGAGETAGIPRDAMRFQGHYYYACADVMTWTEAKEACQRRGGHLATITSEAEQEAILEYLQGFSGRSGYWLGGTDAAEEGVWRWITGEVWDYTNWDKEQPDNYYSLDNISPNGQHDEDYLGMAIDERNWASNGYWNDFSNNRAGSDTLLGYLCEWDYASAWAGEELEKAEDYGLIPDVLKDADYTKPITRLEFAAVAVKTYEKMSGVKALPAVVNPFTDCSDTEVLKAYNLGVVNGMSETAFQPDDLLSREQAAAMLTRVFKRATIPGWTLEKDGEYPLDFTYPAAFADDQLISGYARESVYFMVANSIINGVGGNCFAPKNTTSAQEAQHYANATREQALAIAVRMVENLNLR